MKSILKSSNFKRWQLSFLLSGLQGLVWHCQMTHGSSLKYAVMPAESAPINLTHHFLIAMPNLEDESFSAAWCICVNTTSAVRLV